jgi:4-hydroxybenzoate polyprenyltransferase
MYRQARISAIDAIKPYVQLMRPANVVTAAADVAAGFVVAATAGPVGLAWLLVAGMALYAGGVVMNDVFDAKLDGLERPERPLPSGLASLPAAAALGGACLLLGVVAALQVGPVSALVAAAIAVLALGYDAWGKHRPLWGPLNMGLCRGLNLLLGVSAVPMALGDRWYLALLPIAYVAAITAVSRGEVHGGSRAVGGLALALLGSVLLGLGLLGMTAGGSLLALAPFWLFFAWRTLPPFVAAWQTPAAETIRAAVGAGVMALIALNAVIAAAYGGPVAGLVVLALMLPADGLRRLFAVT